MCQSKMTSGAIDFLLVSLCVAAIAITAAAAYLAPLVPHGELDLVTPSIVALSACACIAAAWKSKSPIAGGIAIAFLVPIGIVLVMAVLSLVEQLRR